MWLAEIVIMTGIWSEDVAGPGARWILWNIRELPRAMSGWVEVVERIRVGKFGPRC